MTALYAVAGVLTLLVLLLAVPLDAHFQLERRVTARGYASIRWLFGLVQFRTDLPASASPPGSARDPDVAARNRKRAKRKTRRRSGAASKFLAVLRQARFRQRCYRFARQLVKAAHLRDVRIAMRLGVGDPADTGRLWGLLGPLSAAAQTIGNAEIAIEPEFMDNVFEIRAHGQVRLIPLQLIALMIAFALSPASLRAWYTLTTGRS